jgi:hypothetical protein
LELNPKELGVIVKKFEHATKKGYVDNHAFLIKFFQLGVDERQRIKVYIPFRLILMFYSRFDSYSISQMNE